MSILTKVFVVLVAVLSIMLVTLVVPFVHNTQNYRQVAEEAKLDAAVASATAKVLQGENEAMAQREVQKVTELKSALQSLQENNGELIAKLASAEATASTEKAAKVQAEANLSRLIAAEEQHAQIVKAMDAELQSRRPEMVKLQRQIIEMIDRNNEISSQLEAQNRLVRNNAEELTQQGVYISQLEEQLAKVSPESRATTAATPTGEFEASTTIQGTVTDVQKADDLTFAQINVGSSDGVQENMKFLVHRSGQYVGTLVVTKVDTKASAGRVKLAQGELAAGDVVLSGPQ